MSDERDGGARRRDFLKLAAAAAPAALAATAAAGPAAADGTAAEAAPDGAGKGLRDTAHTRACYESARF